MVKRMMAFALLNWIVAVLLLVGLPSWGHEPDGVVYEAFEWPPGMEPVIDGVEEPWWLLEYVIPISRSRNEEGEFADTTNSTVYSEILVSWSDDTNRLYIMEWRFDDSWTERDLFLLQLDGDHGGEQIWYSPTEYGDARSDARSNRYGQMYAVEVPEYGERNLSHFTPATWHIEHIDIAYSYPRNIGVAIGWPPHFDFAPPLYIESSWVLWDVFRWNNPEESVVTDLEKGNIIGLGWHHLDVDENDPNDENNPIIGTIWRSSGWNPEIDSGEYFISGATLSDFLLVRDYDRFFGHPPICWKNCPDDGYEPSVVAKRSWGAIKHSFPVP